MTLPTVTPLDRSTEAALRARIDGKAKPLGALGRIEDLAVQLALIAAETPRPERCRLLIFAGDHGLTEDGVSSYPSAVTTLMVATFLAGRATANAFAGAVGGVEVRVVDAGVAADLAPHPNLIDAKVRAGTRNAAGEPALTPAEVEIALERGAEIARSAAAEADVIALGEMGIGNTASAALIVHRLAPAALADCVGAGAGHDAEGLARKHAVLARAAARSAATDPLEVLSEFGGAEIAMMAGAVIGAAAAGRPILVDGFICTAAVLVAVRLQPAVLDHCVFAHRSAERGHAIVLQVLGADPLLDLGMRLGEGSGALLAWPLLKAAGALMAEVASLDDVLGGRL